MSRSTPCVTLVTLLLCMFIVDVVNGHCVDPTGIFCSKESRCPPEGFDAVPDLDIMKYISAPWYIQEQMVNSYQTEDQLFCVRARYELLNHDDISEGVIVYNYANNGEVNGPVSGTSRGDGDFFDLRAIIPDESRPSKLQVGPAFFDEYLGRTIAKAFYGPYWVVALGPSSDEALGYDWAIVSGGPPKVETDGGCRTGRRFLQSFQVNGVGLWLFSRKPVDPENTEIMRAKATELGFDLSVLNPVVQEGCTYEGAD